MNIMVPSHTRTLGMQASHRKHAPATVVCHCPARRQLRQHEWHTHSWLAQRVATLLGHEYGGDFDPAQRYDTPLYFVPSDTLVVAEAKALGIHSEHHLFGGVVPHAFIATKTITHALPDEPARVPQGWSQEFSDRVSTQVLPGFSAFERQDLRKAAQILLAHGSVRMKLPDGIGGVGQEVIRSPEALETFLLDLDNDALQRMGVVVEANLNDVVTYSVGQAVVGDMRITYCGTQNLTANNQGKQVYGGSDLFVVRGSFEALLQQELEHSVHTAISQARLYHEAALACYPGMFASRANYDVAQGWDGEGRWHSGVLEQSWRIGGASAAELAALEVFHADPSVQIVRASTIEQYGEHFEVPANATVYYRGNDEAVGHLTKYSLLKDYGNAR